MPAEPSAPPGQEALSGSRSPPEQLLVLVPHLDEREDRVCADLLTPAPPAAERVLVVSVTDSVVAAHRRWDRRVGAHPAEFAVVSVDLLEEGVGAARDPAPDAESASWLTAHSVSDPGELTGLGVEITGQLVEWADCDEQVVVCLRSLTTMLQYTSVRELVQFLQELQGHLAECDAVAHFHLDPGAVDDETVRSLSHAVDSVVEVGADGVEVCEVG